MWCKVARSIWYYLPRLQGSAVLPQGIVQFHSRYCHWTECPPSWDTHWLLYEYRTAAHSRSFLNVGISNTRNMYFQHLGHGFSFCYCTYECFGGWYSSCCAALLSAHTLAEETAALLAYCRRVSFLVSRVSCFVSRVSCIVKLRLRNTIRVSTYILDQ